MSYTGELLSKPSDRYEDRDKSKPWNMKWKYISGVNLRVRKGKLMVEFVDVTSEEQLDNVLIEAKKFAEEKQYEEFEAAINGEDIRGKIRKWKEAQDKKTEIVEQMKKDREEKKDTIVELEQEVIDDYQSS